MKTVIAYCRVSTEEQAMEGISLDAQEARCRAYAALHDLPEPEAIIDPGYTGATLKRPGLVELIERCERDEVGHVIVVALDRLSRRIRDTLYLVSDVFDDRTTLHSIRETLDTSSPAGRFVLHMFAAVSELERGLIAERISAALQQKRCKGERLGRPPLGFAEGPGELQPLEAELEVVKRIHALRRKERSLRAIAQVLDGEGIPTKRGGRWSAETVRAILANPRYAPYVGKSRAAKAQSQDRTASAGGRAQKPSRT